MADRTVRVILTGAVTGLVGSFQTAKKSAKDFGAEMDTMSTKNEGAYSKLNRTSTLAGGALVAGFALAAKAAYDFDKQMSAVAAVSDASATQLSGLRDAAIKAGQQTAFTATQAAVAEEELAKAGISTADILSGGLTGALNLASAGSLDLGTAAKFASQAMIEFNLHGKDMAHIADVLTAGANKSVTDVQGLGDALGQAGTVAHQAGLNLDETVGVLSLFAQHGLDGVEAGTTFKTMLLKLENPTAKAAGLMQSLGLKVYDSAGNFLSASKLADALHTSLAGLTEAQRNQALGEIFGTRAVRGAIDLYNAGAKGVNDWTAAVNDSGLAAKTANTKLDNLSGDVHKLIGSLDALAITSSGGATTGLRFLAQGAEKSLNFFSGLPKPVQETVSVLSGLAGVTLLAGSGFMKLKGSINQSMDALASSGPMGAKAAGALGKIGSIAGKAGLWGAAALVAYEGIKTLFGYLNKNAGPVKRSVDGLTTSLSNFAQTGAVTGELQKTFGSNLQGLATDMRTLMTAEAKIKALQSGVAGGMVGLGGKGGAEQNPAISALQVQLSQARGDITATDSALAKLTTSGGGVQALAFFHQLTTQLEASGYSFAQITAMFPQYNKAAEAAAYANTGLAQGFGTAQTNAADLASTMDDLIAKGQTFTTEWKQLNGALLGTQEAKLAANQSLEDLIKTMKKNKDAIHGNSDAALEDNIAIGKMAEAAAAAATATYLQTGSVSKASKTYDDYIGQLRKVLMSIFHNKTEVDALLKAYAKMPKSVVTDVKTPGVDTAKKKVKSLHDWIYNIPKHRTTTFLTEFQTKGTPPSQYYHGNRMGGVYQHAAVGALRDAGVYAPVSSGARYAFAEPATHGEAFIPHTGNLQRSRAISDYVTSRWLGGHTTWDGQAGGGGGGGPVQILVTAAPGAAAAHMQFLRFEVDQRGGNVQAVIGRKGS